MNFIALDEVEIKVANSVKAEQITIVKMIEPVFLHHVYSILLNCDNNDSTRYQIFNNSKTYQIRGR
ncbi:hypothetical protein [Pseudoalteromonas sp. P1-9]|uniref:hypothetical protein n=1 Tax=Pseudoalteromonas sp. P1-9 TaxID=1710354 RepID=UPI0006D6295F|nr:hypothetical protein [Pseudoalteromonas sp. P1-9]